MFKKPHEHPLLDENSPENAKFRSLIEYIRIAHEVNLESFFKGKRRREFIIRKFIDASPLPFSVKSKLQDYCDSEVGFLNLSEEKRQELDEECDRADDGAKFYKDQMDQLIRSTTLLSSATGDSDDFHAELKLLAREAGHYRAVNFLYEQLNAELINQQSTDEITKSLQDFWNERGAEQVVRQREKERTEITQNPFAEEVDTAKSSEQSGKGAWQSAEGMDGKTTKVKSLVDQAEHHRKLKEYKSALKAYKKALKVDPQSSMALNRLRHFYEILSRSSDGAEYLQMAILADANDGLAHCYLGHYYRHLGDAELAKKHYGEAIEIDPSLMAEAAAQLSGVGFAAQTAEKNVHRFDPEVLKAIQEGKVDSDGNIEGDDGRIISAAELEDAIASLPEEGQETHRKIDYAETQKELKIWKELGDWEEIKALITKGINSAEQSIQGMNENLKRRKSESSEEYKESLEHQKISLEALTECLSGYKCMEIGDDHFAIQHFRKALELDESINSTIRLELSRRRFRSQMGDAEMSEGSPKSINVTRMTITRLKFFGKYQLVMREEDDMFNFYEEGSTGAMLSDKWLRACFPENNEQPRIAAINGGKCSMVSPEWADEKVEQVSMAEPDHYPENKEEPMRLIFEDNTIGFLTADGVVLTDTEATQPEIQTPDLDEPEEVAEEGTVFVSREEFEAQQSNQEPKKSVALGKIAVKRKQAGEAAIPLPSSEEVRKKRIPELPPMPTTQPSQLPIPIPLPDGIKPEPPKKPKKERFIHQDEIRVKGGTQKILNSLSDPVDLEGIQRHYHLLYGVLSDAVEVIDTDEGYRQIEKNAELYKKIVTKYSGIKMKDRKVRLGEKEVLLKAFNHSKMGDVLLMLCEQEKVGKEYALLAYHEAWKDENSFVNLVAIANAFFRLGDTVEDLNKAEKCILAAMDTKRYPESTVTTVTKECGNLQLFHQEIVAKRKKLSDEQSNQ